MNPTPENHEPTAADDLHDRLIDRALAEVAGGERPPDLASRILVERSAGVAEATGSRPARVRRAWAGLAIAAAIFIGTLPLLLPTMRGPRQAAMNPETEMLNNKVDLSEPILVDRISSRGAAADSAAAANGSPAATEAASGPRSVSLATAPTAAIQDQQARELEQLQSGLSGQNDALAVDKSLATAHAGSTPDGEAADGQAEATGGTNGQFAGNGGLPSPAEQYGGPLNIRFKQNSISLSESGPGVSVGFVPTQNIGLQGLVGGEHWGERRDWQLGLQTSEGSGPGTSGDQYTRIHENRFIEAIDGDALSTFSIDVDTASYTNARQFLMQMSQLPPADAIRIEELVNYFEYDYAGPADDTKDSPESSATADADPAADDADTPEAEGERGPAGAAEEPATDVDVAAAEAIVEGLAPFAAHVEVASCPWMPAHRLVRIGIKGREIDQKKRPLSNLVFLVDVSGSMNAANKLPLVVDGLLQLTRELGENDRVAIVVYASSEGLVLPSTPGDDQATILTALGRLQAGGSTAGGAGIQLAYQLAEDHFIPGGTNRVILCTDGDFNVGITSTSELERMVEQKAKDTGVFLSVLGFGRGNLNDAMMEAISNRGNGNYSYVDNSKEARRVLVEQLTGTLVTIAKDVKIQVEFNPRQVAGYRLIGYENRMLRTEDFNDDTKDAGEIGAGHTVTALYEVVPAGKAVGTPESDPLKYQPSATARQEDQEEAGQPDATDFSGELLTLKMRYKQPEGDSSRKLEWAVTDEGAAFSEASGDLQFAAAVAGFGMLLRDSQYKGNLTFDAALEMAQGGIGEDAGGHRAEFLEMIRRAKALRGQ